MTRVSHQTIKLSRGKHASPETGACVMELASMLAGERFTDHPASVSKVIAAFLRGYNDLLDDLRRQDLYEYASKTVGTAGSDEIEEARTRRLLEWAEEERFRSGRSSVLRRFTQPRLSRTRKRDAEAVAAFAVRAIGESFDTTHRSALSLVDELIAMGISEAGRFSAEFVVRAPQPESRRSHRVLAE